MTPPVPLPPCREHMLPLPCSALPPASVRAVLQCAPSCQCPRCRLPDRHASPLTATRSRAVALHTSPLLPCSARRTGP